MPKGDKSVIIKDVELVPYLHMVWENKRMENGELLYKRHPEGTSEEMIFDENEALAHLLASQQVFLNSHWWMKEKEMDASEKDKAWPEDACKTFSINANVNDVFCWGCADAEEVEYSELESLYEHFHKDPSWGTAIWGIKKRGIFPQKPVEDAIRKAGIWDLDSMGLEENPSEKYYREKAEKEKKS